MLKNKCQSTNNSKIEITEDNSLNITIENTKILVKNNIENHDNFEKKLDNETWIKLFGFFLVKSKWLR